MRWFGWGNSKAAMMPIAEMGTDAGEEYSWWRVCERERQTEKGTRREEETSTPRTPHCAPHEPLPLPRPRLLPFPRPLSRFSESLVLEGATQDEASASTKLLPQPCVAANVAGSPTTLSQVPQSSTTSSLPAFLGATMGGGRAMGATGLVSTSTTTEVPGMRELALRARTLKVEVRCGRVW